MYIVGKRVYTVCVVYIVTSILCGQQCVYVVYIVGRGAFDVFGQACSGEHPTPDPPPFI